MNILAVGAHPDDIEFGCAHALLLETQRGNRTDCIVLTRGEAASSGTPAEREQESREAAALMGVNLTFLDAIGSDCHLMATPAHTLILAAEIRRLRPSIVLAPHPHPNQHPDHAAAGEMVRDACRLARYGGLLQLKPAPAHSVSSLYFYNITRHGAAVPDLVVDIGSVMNQWRAVMECHRTQVSSKNYIDLQISHARWLGLASGVEYAAGFHLNDPVRVESLSSLPLSSRAF